MFWFIRHMGLGILSTEVSTGTGAKTLRPTVFLTKSLKPTYSLYYGCTRVFAQRKLLLAPKWTHRLCWPDWKQRQNSTNTSTLQKETCFMLHKRKPWLFSSHGSSRPNCATNNRCNSEAGVFLAWDPLPRSAFSLTASFPEEKHSTIRKIFGYRLKTKAEKLPPEQN